MTYDENDDYNGPDSTRRGPFLFMAALVGVILVAGFGAAVSEARADPNTVTVLPADGVQSITRDGDLWTVATDGPASEIKYMGPGAQQIICGTNYGDPCTTVETFTATGECVYLQLDGIPGHNSSDPYICLGGTPSTTSNPTSIPSGTPEPSPTPTSTPTTTSPAVPPFTTTPTTTTPATAEPYPSPTPTSSPTSTPEPSSNPNPSPTPSETTVPSTSSQTPGASTDIALRTSPSTWEASPTSAPARLADTGTNIWGLGLVMFLSMTLGLGALVIARRTL